jgi:hypothetical protein
MPLEAHSERLEQSLSDRAAIKKTYSCLHRRMIDDVRDDEGRRTGRVRCLECQTIFADPYMGNR